LDVADSPPGTQAMAMLTIAMRAADLALSDDAKTKRIFGNCAGSTITDSCMQAFVNNFGLKTYRRPLTPAESQSLMDQFHTAGGGQEGMNRVLARLLMSPTLVFHLEPGVAGDGTRVRLTDYEVASRLSYRLVNTMPDQELLDAAGKGLLQDLGNVRSQGLRLLGASAGKTAVSDFFRYYMKLDSVPTPNAFAANLDGVDPASIKGEMVQELQDFANNVVWTKQGTFKDLYASAQVFPRSAGMAKILETAVPAGANAATTTADHAGLLLRPAFLSGGATLTSPYHRALIVRSNILCETFGAPDPTAINNRQAELGDLSQLSNRDRLSALTNSQSCLGCHSMLNPVGFALEGYDQLGVKRTAESVFNATSGAVEQTHPVNTAVVNTHINDVNGEVKSFTDATDLQRAIASGPDARACFARRIFEFQRARTMAAADSCALREIESASSSNGTLQNAFVNSVANTDIFFKAQGN
jgi:hypothetical protein